MKLLKLTYLINQLNALIDTGKHNQLSIGEVESHIEAGDVFHFIGDLGKGDIDLSLIDGNEEIEINAALQDIYFGNAGRERKWGVRNNGLCLLLAWVNELIQMRRWKD